MNAIYSLVSNYRQAKDELATAVPEITAYVVFISKKNNNFRVTIIFFTQKNFQVLF